jgi:hypothetical protein
MSKAVIIITKREFFLVLILVIRKYIGLVCGLPFCQKRVLKIPIISSSIGQHID